jgi:hypothetical protein
VNDTQVVADDVEAELDNSRRHYRCNLTSVPLALPGTIIEASCGALFRAKGRRLPPGETHSPERCPDCHAACAERHPGRWHR